MKLQLTIALRYLFSKKSNNIINIISIICAIGVCVATIALVCTLSVYNGFQRLISNVVSSFDPDLKITLHEGKTFDPTAPLTGLYRLSFVKAASEVLEESALIKSKDKQSFATIKGVSTNYNNIIDSDSIMESGRFLLKDVDDNFCVLGAALAIQINATTNFMSPVSFFAPKYATNVNLAIPSNSFNSKELFVSGIYATHQMDIDSKYAFLPIDYARTLFNYGNVATSIEVKLKDGANLPSAKREISNLLGSKFAILDQQEQHEDFYRMMHIEKWFTFFILFFILLIAVINIISSLTMLILEKKNDIQTLRNLGATPQFVREVFLLEGWLVSALGAIVGLVTGLLLCLIQQYFGVIKLGSAEEADTFLVSAYPVYVQWSDLLIILGSILVIGWVIAYIPTKHIDSQRFR